MNGRYRADFVPVTFITRPPGSPGKLGHRFPLILRVDETRPRQNLSSRQTVRPRHIALSGNISTKFHINCMQTRPPIRLAELVIPRQTDKLVHNWSQTRREARVAHQSVLISRSPGMHQPLGCLEWVNRARVRGPMGDTRPENSGK